MAIKIVPIVEGHAEVEAVPVLLRRIARDLQLYDVEIGKPVRCHRQKLVNPDELERTVELAALKSGREGRILLLLDADSDCPAQLGPDLLERATEARGDIRVGVALAKREFEAWFLGSLESLLSESPVATRQAFEGDPEEISGAKERLSGLINAPYSEVIDQPSFAAIFDMGMARQRCPSFDKLWRTVEDLLLCGTNSL